MASVTSNQSLADTCAGLEHRAVTTISSPSPETALSLIAKELEEIGKILLHSSDRLALETVLGIIDGIILNETIQITIYANDVSNLHMQREAVNHYAEDHMGLPPLTWSDEKQIEAGTLPPNCRIAAVTNAEPFGPNFIRITLQAERLESYSHSSLHFRIGIPPKGVTPLWPRVSSKGKTVWPEDDHKLHLPAYTTVSVDPSSDALTFDVFSHGNGETCAWASGLVDGTDTRKTILLSGPGGDWIPPTEHLLLAGDETAFPAIRRTLEAVKPNDNVLTFIEMGTTEDVEHFAKQFDQHDITWLARAEGQSARQAILALSAEQREGRYFWFAGEKKDSSILRELANGEWDISKDNRYIAGYWNQ